MLLLVDLRGILVPTSLLYDELHGLHSLSHPGVELYLYGVNMEMDVLTETNQLRQRLVHSFLQVGLRHLKGDASIRSSVLHAVGEKSHHILRLVFVVICDSGATHNGFFAGI